MKMPYFKLTDAFKEAKDSFAYGSGTDKVSSTAKLLGKTVANAGLLAVETGVEIVKNLPELNGRMAQRILDEKSNDLPAEKVQELRDRVAAGKKHEKQRRDREREEERKEREKRAERN